SCPVCLLRPAPPTPSSSLWKVWPLLSACILCKRLLLNPGRFSVGIVHRALSWQGPSCWKNIPSPLQPRFNKASAGTCAAVQGIIRLCKPLAMQVGRLSERNNPMFEDEYHGGVRQEKRAGIRPFIPVLGFLLILSMGAIGFVIGPNVAAFASQRMGFEISDEIIWIFRGVIFFLLM